MSRRYFGTDGVRGIANTKLTPEFAFKLAQAAGRWAKQSGVHGRVVIGRDTRRSGTMLGAALASGFNSVGINVVTLGVAPTPTVAYVARTGGFDLGVIVSASHNPAPDNGIKFVTSAGTKSPDELELIWEADLDSVDTWIDTVRGPGAAVGTIEAQPELAEGYLDYLASILPEGLGGMRVVLDAAHGAGYLLGPRLLERLGADVIAVGVLPDGLNINAEGGATRPEITQALTVKEGAAVGIAFDGDADRCVFSDDKGRLINGDRTMGAWAVHQASLGKLNPPIVVGTVMSNVGFEEYLTAKGIQLERTPVGDKYVSKRIGETHARIGGEQSGHLVFPEHGPTGDGLATMLEFLGVLVRSGRTSSDWVDEYVAWPQLLVNVQVGTTEGWVAVLQEELAVAEEEIAGKGRILVRASGTQPMIRVMVEAKDVNLRDQITNRLVSALLKGLGGHIHGTVDLTHALGD